MIKTVDLLTESWMSCTQLLWHLLCLAMARQQTADLHFRNVSRNLGLTKYSHASGDWTFCLLKVKNVWKKEHNICESRY